MADMNIVLSIIGKDLASKEIGHVTQSLDQLESKAGGAGSALSAIATGATVAGIAAVGAGLAAAVVTAADFEQTMSGVKAVSGATADEMAGLQDLALRLGADTSFSAKEAAQGLEELVKGGLSIPDIMDGALESTLALAAAGGVKLPEAATIAANALAQFSLKGTDMAHVADLIAGAANASAIDVGQFKYSLQAAGAVAATVGFSFDDLAQGIAIMGKAGIVGSDAGTSLKTMMLNLQPSTKKATEQFRELGLITADGANQFFTAEGRVKSMAEVADLLQDATKDLTQAQRLQALETMFGSDAIRAAAVLAKEGASGFEDMAASMGKVTAASVAADRLDNLKGSLEQLKGSLETAAITVGLELLPTLKDLLDGVTPLVNRALPGLKDAAVAVAAGFKALQPVVSGFFNFLVDHGGTIAGLVAGFATFSVLLTVAGWVSAAAAAFTAFGGVAAGLIAGGGGIAAVVAFLGGPVTIAILAISAAVALLSVAWANNWGDIQGKTKAVTDFVSEHGDTIKDVLTMLLGPIGALAVAWEHNFGDIQGKTGAVGTFIKDGLESWATIFDKTGTMIHNFVDGVGQTFDRLGTLTHDLTTNIGDQFDRFGTDTREQWDQLTGWLGTTWDTLKTTAGTKWTALTDRIGEVVDGFKTDAEATWAALSTALGAAWAAFVQPAAEKWQAITAAIGQVVEDFKAVAREKWEALGTLVGGVWTTFVETTRTHWATITSTVGTAITDAQAGLRQRWQDIADAISGVWAAAVGTATAKWTEITSAVRTTITGALEGIRSAGAGIVQALQDGIGGAVGGFMAWLKTNLIDKIPEQIRTLLGIHSPSSVMAEIGGHLVDGLRVGIEQRLPNLQTAISGMLGSVSGAVSGNVTDWLQQAIQLTGVPAGWLGRLQQLVQVESTGNPRAVNPEAVYSPRHGYEHATGLMQTLPSTFAENALPGMGDILNPVHNAVAAIRYILGHPLYRGDINRVPLTGYRAGGQYREHGYLVGDSGAVHEFHGTASQPEAILNARQWEQVRAAALGEGRGPQREYNITVHAPRQDATAQELVRALRRFELLQA